MGTGRPEIYTDKLADEFCARLSTSNKGMHSICKAADMPSYRTVFKWINDKKLGFSHKYAQAKELQAEFMRDEIIEISDESSNDTIETESGKKIANNEWMQRSKLRVETRKWLMSKMAPKGFGDSSKLDISVVKDLPIFSDPKENGGE